MRPKTLPFVSIAILSFTSVFVSPVAANFDLSKRSPAHKRALRNRLLDDALDSTVHDDSVHLQKRDETKYVFMHHIVGNTYDYNYTAWATDFSQILAKNIDAVALNVGGDSWQWAQITTAYDAAAAIGMKLFISFDYTSFACDVGTTVSWVNQLSSKSAQFKVDGRPMISSYSGYCLGAGGWQSVRDQTGGYLMPFIYGQDYQTLRSGSTFGFFDSWYCWGCAWPQGNYNKTTADDQYYTDILGNRYATTVSGWMYTHYSDKNFYQRGDDWLLISRWEQLIAMRNQLSFVEMVTWNDFGESDYFGPLTAGLQPDGTTWANNFPHTAFFDLSEYYIAAFKTGTYPRIQQDVIYFWLRPHPAGISANSDPLPKPSGWDWTSDTLWAAAFCSSNCSVALQVGSSSQEFVNLGYGVHKVSLPLNSFGSVTVKMSKNGQEVINYTPSDFEYQSSTDKHNYNAYVGSASASTGVLTSSTTSTTAFTATSSATATTTSTSSAISATSTSTSTSGWTTVGCVAEGKSGSRRALTGASYTLFRMTPSLCQSLCQDYSYAGVEFGQECYCGNTLQNNGASGSVVDSGYCQTTCAGDSSQDCGGVWYLDVYKRASTTTSSAPVTSSTPSTSSTASISSSGYLGCMAEGTTGSRRALTGASYTDSSMTPVRCQSLCAGYKYAGVEYGSECYCGNSFTGNEASGTIVSDNQCTSTCAGDSSKICGGAWMLSLYSGSGSSSSSSWTSRGCYVDNSARILQGKFVDLGSSATAESCIATCSGLGFSISGTEYGTQCMCGNSLVNASPASSSDCDSKCAGDSSEACGGTWRANVYIAPGTSL